MKRRFRQNPLFRVFGSLKLMLFILVTFAVSIGAATLIESAQGTPAARAMVYNSLWFESLLGLLILNLIFQLFARMPYRGGQTGFVILHIAMIVILISAGITRFFGYEGMMSIREGQSTDFMYSSKEYLQLKRGGETAEFPVILYKPGKQSASGHLKLGGDTYRAQVEEFWPNCQEALVADPAGVPALHYAISAGEGPERSDLLAGESRKAGKIDLRFIEGDFPPAAANGPFGRVLAHYKGQHAAFDVSRADRPSVTVGGLRIQLIEFHADYARRDEQPEPAEMSNPMVSVSIAGPGGEQGARSLFAYFPDFSMAHGGGEEAFADLQLSYEFGQTIEFSAARQGKLNARASFQLDVIDMMTQEVREVIEPGVEFEMATRQLYRAGEVTLVPLEYLPAASYQPTLTDNQSFPAAARIAVTGPGGETERVFVRRGERGRPVRLGGENLTVAIGPVRIALPYRLYLEDFELITYPGSSNPASYESHVQLFDDEKGIQGAPVRIYMNHPLTHRGYKHFQSSYDRDMLGTVLSVNHDPGKWPTYFGYALLTLGFLMLTLRPLLWPKGGRQARSEA